jgi:regulator of sigma E protease
VLPYPQFSFIFLARFSMLDSTLQFLQYASAFVFILTVIVFIHEFGHYFIARRCGVKVEAFAIGFGKELFGYTAKSGTRWKFCALPLGGYVKMYGDASAASTPDNDALEKLTEEQKRMAFHYQPLAKKAAIVAGGPLFNFLLTIAILTAFIYTSGISSTEPVIGKVIENSAAQDAGLREGDRILAIDSKEVDKFNDIASIIMLNTGKEVTLSIARGTENLSVPLVPRFVEDKDALGNTIRRPLIGIQSQQLTFHDVNPAQALWEATKSTYNICTATLKAVGQMITGERGTEELRGPLGIAQMSGQASEQGWRTIFWFIAMLSANLGLVNLFPIPLLDGGHLLYYGVEAVRGKPLAEKIQEYGFRFGFAVLLTLMAFTLFNDVRALFS